MAVSVWVAARLRAVRRPGADSRPEAVRRPGTVRRSAVRLQRHTGWRPSRRVLVRCDGPCPQEDFLACDAPLLYLRDIQARHPGRAGGGPPQWRYARLPVPPEYRAAPV